MNFNNAPKLYKAIKTEYDNSKEKKISGKTYDAKTLRRSFAYRYFKHWKEQTVNKYYINDREWVDKYIKSDDFAKNYSRKNCPDKYGMVYAAYKLFEEKRIDIDQCKRVFIYFAGKKAGNKNLIEKIKDGDEEEIKKAYEKLSYDLLCKVIGDHLKKGFDKDSIDDINMLYEFCRYSNMDEYGIDDAVVVSDDYINKCQGLFELLLSDGSGKAEKVFIPLYVDRSSGAGIYIIGSSRLGLDKEDTAKMTKLGKCSVYTASFLENVDYIDLCPTDDGALDCVTLMINYEFKSFESVKKAFDEIDDNDFDRYSNYQRLNSNDLYDPVKEKFGETFLEFFRKPQKIKDKRMNAAMEEKRIENEALKIFKKI